VFKTTLLKKIKEGNMNQLKQAQEQIVALQEQLKQATASLQMVSKRLEDQGQTVDKVNSLINQNRGLNRALLELYNEAMVKLSQADQVIKAQGAEYANVMQDAQTMAQMMAEDEKANTQSAELDAQALNAMLGQ
jgi:chromosome segregation ATPase